MTSDAVVDEPILLEEEEEEDEEEEEVAEIPALMPLKARRVEYRRALLPKNEAIDTVSSSESNDKKKKNFPRSILFTLPSSLRSRLPCGLVLESS